VPVSVSAAVTTSTKSCDSLYLQKCDNPHGVNIILYGSIMASLKKQTSPFINYNTCQFVCHQQWWNIQSQLKV